MDITTSYGEYLAALATADSIGFKIFLAFLGLSVVMGVVMAVHSMPKDKKYTGWARFGEPVAYLVGLPVLGIVLGAFGGLAVATSVDHERFAPAYQSVAEDINTAYATDIPVSTVQEALAAGDRDVVLVQATHDGKVKSLGLTINEETRTATVYEGNVALDPGQ